MVTLATDKTITVQDGGTLRYGRVDNPGLLDAAGKSILVIGAGSLYDGQQTISVDGGALRATAGGRITGEFVRMQSGTLTLDGADATDAGTATLRLQGDAQATLTRSTNVGSDANFSGGSGRIIVGDSARLDVGSLFISTNRGFGTVQVSGGIGDVGRIVQSASSFLQVGSNDAASNGRLEININGEFTTAAVPIDVFKQGVISVGQGTFNANADLNIKGGLLQRFSENFGGFNLAAGKNLTVTDAGQLLFSDKLVIPDGSKLTLRAAATGSSVSLLTGNGAGQTGTALFEGQDTAFEINGFASTNPVVPSRVGSDGGDATITVRDRAFLQIVTPIDLAAGTAANTSAALNISGGATAELASFNLATDGSAGGMGTITVSGPGTKLETRLGSQSTLNLGHATQGTATLTVENGAEYVGGERIVFGKNVINVNATGTVNGSRFIADAINLNGGTFNYTNGVLDFDTFTGDLTQDGGTLTPNTFDRAMTIDGDYTLNDGTVSFNIRQGFDNSISADSIDLGTQGLLDVSATVFQSLPYTVGDTFTILSSDTPIVGAFATQDIIVFNDKTFDVIYNPTSVVLEVVAATSVIGDYNADGFVNQADLDLVLLNWGNIILPAGWINTDQFDGVQVSQNELDGVLLNWGNGTPGMTPPTTANVNTIPGPASAALLALSGLLACRRRHGRPVNSRWRLPRRRIHHELLNQS